MVKQGYIRTLEAVIAIVIILLFIFTITPTEVTNPSDVPAQVKTAQGYILSEIANEPLYRDEALGVITGGQCGGEDPPGVAPNINEFVSLNIPPGFDYACMICLTTDCVFSSSEGITTSVYVDDIMIAPPDTSTSPKIVRIWLWQVA